MSAWVLALDIAKGYSPPAQQLRRRCLPIIRELVFYGADPFEDVDCLGQAALDEMNEIWKIFLKETAIIRSLFGKQRFLNYSHSHSQVL